MKYDIKIYEEENGEIEEAETIRDLTYSQMHTITQVLLRHKIKHTVFRR